MSVNTILSVPGLDHRANGGDALVRLHPYHGGQAVPVEPIELAGLYGLETGPYRPARTASVFGPGELLPVPLGFDYGYTGEMELLSVCAAELLCSVSGRDWDPAGPGALPVVVDELPAGVLEVIIRDADRQSQIMTHVLPGVNIYSHGMRVNPGTGRTKLPFGSSRMPFYLPAGTKIVMDRYTGDGETCSYLLSQSPIRLHPDDEPLPDFWPDPFLVDVGVTLPGSVRANPVTEGIELDGQTLLFSDPPAPSSVIRVVYAGTIE